MSGPPPGHMPPPPPPPPPGDFRADRPTSGKAVAALVCGLFGFLVICLFPALAAFVGLILGIFGIMETGPDGKRKGRGLAIAGVIVCVLSLGANAAWFGYSITATQRGIEEGRQANAENLRHDSDLIVKRLMQYAQENNGELGPGGPILAERDAPAEYASNRPVEPPRDGADSAEAVEGELELGHLVAPWELKWRRSDGWTLTITGRNSATLTAEGWRGEPIWQIQIRDAERGRTVQTAP